MLSLGLLFLVTMVTTTSQDCIQLHSKEGFKLVGYQYKEMNHQDMLSCFTICKEESYCRSVNFNIQQSKCELNNNTRESSPSSFVTAEFWVYFDNPFKAVIGSNKTLAGKSCKSIRDSLPDIHLANQEYWIDPGNTMQPFPVYCDMNTDGGGWTLIASTVINTDNETIDEMVRETDYRAISNYATNNVRIDVPAIRQLRDVMGFTQLRYHCHQKTAGRTLHIITKKNQLGENVVEYFTKDNKTQTLSCDSYFRGPGDTSVLAANCQKWDNHGNTSELGKWGYYQHTGTYRIYNEPLYWNGDGVNKYFVNFIPGRLCCDQDKSNFSHLSVGDFWQVFVK